MLGPSEDQKKQMYDSLSPQQKSNQSYTDWVKDGYNNQYNKWMPWVEDKYLEWFGTDNKASYITKDTLDKTKVTGIGPVDQLQGDVNSLVGNQVGKNGVFGGVGDMASKEGINRAERGGKDESGSYDGPAANATDPIIRGTKDASQGLTGSAQSAGSTVAGGLSSAGDYVGGMFGGEKK